MGSRWPQLKRIRQKRKQTKHLPIFQTEVISESKTNIDSVFDFFMNKKTDGEVEISVDDDYDDTEDYYTSHDKYGNPFNDYPK